MSHFVFKIALQHQKPIIYKSIVPQEHLKDEFFHNWILYPDCILHFVIIGSHIL